MTEALKKVPQAAARLSDVSSTNLPSKAFREIYDQLPDQVSAQQIDGQATSFLTESSGVEKSSGMLTREAKIHAQGFHSRPH